MLLSHVRDGQNVWYFNMSSILPASPSYIIFTLQASFPWQSIGKSLLLVEEVDHRCNERP
jgi:hypothetical protein